MPRITPQMKSWAFNMLKAVSFKYDWSFNKSINFVREQLGYCYRTSDALEDFRRWKGTLKYQYHVERLHDSSFIPERLIVDTDLHRAHKYRVFEMVKMRNKETGEEMWSMKSHFSDNYLTKGQYAWEFVDWFNRKYKDYEWEAVDARVTNLWHNVGMPW